MSATVAANSIKNFSKNMCFGCGSCAAKCPNKAIKMKKDDLGFLYPEIDESKCTNCAVCTIHCPVINNIKPTPPLLKAYLVKSVHSLDCASGGAFYEMGLKILSENGYAAGAVWDDNMVLKIAVTNKKETLEKMRGSKYVQASAANSFAECEKLLKQNKKVLYSATPCLVDGLYNYLGKDYDNLITIEILCHGVSSPKAWEKYVKYACKKYNKRIIDCKMSSSKSQMTFYFDDNTQITENFHAENEFAKLFSHNYIIRDCCFVCPYRSRIRKADLIIGDLWAKWAQKDRQEGVSVVMINSKKGQEFFDTINWEKCSKFDINDKRNGPINKINDVFCYPNPKSAKVKEKIRQNCDFEKIIENKDVAIMNFNYPRDNYGALLLAWALEFVLKKLGYNPYTINFYKNPLTMDFNPQGATWKFREEFLTLWGFYYNKNDLLKINNDFDKIIFGSDIIWASDREYVYFGDWVTGRKNMIAYAASLRENKPIKKDKYKKKCFRRFDKISVREYSARELLKNFANVDSTFVCDPTLLLKAKDYQTIIDKQNSDIPKEDYIGYYTFWHLNPYKMKLKYAIYDLFRDENNETRSFGQWLNMIKNAKGVVSGSYHGVVFCLIYNVPFMYIKKPQDDNERVMSLFNYLGLDKKRIVDDESAVSGDIMFSDMDWDRINKKIDEFSSHSLSWLKEALEADCKYKYCMVENNDHFVLDFKLFRIKFRKKS